MYIILIIATVFSLSTELFTSLIGQVEEFYLIIETLI